MKEIDIPRKAHFGNDKMVVSHKYESREIDHIENGEKKNHPQTDEFLSKSAKSLRNRRRYNYSMFDFVYMVLCCF